MAVFHLKYRPTNWSELDLGGVAEKIKRNIESNTPGQAYLFAGPKGAGKTSAARILAKAVNCENPVKGEPCNKCPSCKEINSGVSLDIMELDGASNRGIEDVRSLKDKAYLLPSRLKRKVFIIDEVHMLTKEAFNALLKLLEEPPEHTIFVLCTTEEGKIPETVMSRLIKVEFRKGTRKELEKSLMRIIDGESVEVEGGVVELLTSRSDGSFRNLQRMFNEMVVELGKKITNAAARDYVSKGAVELGAEELEVMLARKSAKKIIEHWERMAEIGFDFREYRERVVEYFQKQLVAIYGGNYQGPMELGGLTKWLNLLILAGKQEKEAVIGQLPLQLAVVEFLGEGEEDEGLKVDGRSSKKKVIKKKNKETKTVKEVYKVEPGLEVERVKEDWGKLMTVLKPYNHSVEAFLRGARPVKVEGSILVVEVFYPFHRDKLNEARNKQIVEMGIKKVWGAEMAVEYELGKNKSKAVVIGNETPEEKKGMGEEKDLYDVAKEIFG